MEKLELTPEKILNMQFDVDFKGYSANEVDSFLDVVLEDYQKMEENTERRAKLFHKKSQKNRPEIKRARRKP